MNKSKESVSVYIEPSMLNNSDIPGLVLSLLNSEKTKLNSSERGYVTEILSVVIDGNETQIDGRIRLYTTIEFMTVLPTIGEILHPKVGMLLQTGIFCMMHNNISFLVPPVSTLGYKLKGDVYYNNETNNTISVGDIIPVEIVDTRYEDKTFNCVAKLVEV